MYNIGSAFHTACLYTPAFFTLAFFDRIAFSIPAFSVALCLLQTINSYFQS